MTAVLSLDATVVLLTPVVFAALQLGPKPHVYACLHLANSASLLLPVSNLTNLLAFRFGAAMALPWLAAIGVESVVLRGFFPATGSVGAIPPSDSRLRAPRSTGWSWSALHSPRSPRPRWSTSTPPS